MKSTAPEVQPVVSKIDVESKVIELKNQRLEKL
jgi:hypothetical protein